MAIKLNTIFTEAGLDVAEVRLLRHRDNKASKGRTPYELWRDSPEQLICINRFKIFIIERR